MNNIECLREIDILQLIAKCGKNARTSSQFTKEIYENIHTQKQKQAPTIHN